MSKPRVIEIRVTGEGGNYTATIERITKKTRELKRKAKHCAKKAKRDAPGKGPK